MCPYRWTTPRVLRDYSRFGHSITCILSLWHTRGTTRSVQTMADVNTLNQPQSWLTRDDSGNIASEGWKDEGYVWVTPWWDLDNPMKVCAFDAQLTEISSTGTDCSTIEANTDPECGCGENLKWCTAGDNGIEGDLSSALSEHVRTMLNSGAPYSTLIKVQMMVNGPIVVVLNRSNFSTILDDLSPLSSCLSCLKTSQAPGFPSQWEMNMRGSDRTWLLLRHQTDRGRASCFYSILCREFQAPNGGIQTHRREPNTRFEPQTGVSGRLRFEPWAAYWGRWQPAGAIYLSQEVPTTSTE